MVKGERRGCIRLKDAFVGYDNEDDITFTITVDEKTFHLQSKNLDEREKWVSRIERTIRQHTTTNINNGTNSKNDSMKTNNLESSIDSVYKFKSSLNNAVQFNDTNSLESSYEYNNMSSNTSRLNKSDFMQFDSSLTESDAYLQLLIEQLKGLESRKVNLLKDKSAIEVKKSDDSFNSVLSESKNGDVISINKEEDAQYIDSVITATEVISLRNIEIKHFCTYHPPKNPH